MFRWVPQDAGTCPGTAQTAGALCSEAFAGSHGGDAPRIDNLSCQWEASGLHSPRKAGRRHCQAQRGQLQLLPQDPFQRGGERQGAWGSGRGSTSYQGREERQASGPNFSTPVSHPHPRERLPEPHEPSCSSSST